jgi:hypothetical protein
MGGEDICVQDLMEKPEGKRPLVRPRFRWEDISKITHRMGWRGLIGLWIERGGGIFCIM